MHRLDNLMPPGNRPEAMPAHQLLRDTGTRVSTLGKRHRARSSGGVTGIATGVAYEIAGFFIVKSFKTKVSCPSLQGLLTKWWFRKR